MTSFILVLSWLVASKIELDTMNLLSYIFAGYNSTYTGDKHYGVSAYAISSSVEQIQTEIMKHGPVEAAFTVYADFPSYKSGKIKSF